MHSMHFLKNVSGTASSISHFSNISKESVLVVYISPHNFSFSIYVSACADKHMNWHQIEQQFWFMLDES